MGFPHFLTGFAVEEMVALVSCNCMADLSASGGGLSAAVCALSAAGMRLSATETTLSATHPIFNNSQLKKS